MEEGEICIIDCTYLFSLQVNMNGKSSVFEAHSEGPKIQEAYRSFSKKYIKMIYLQKPKDGFLGVIMQNQKTGTWSTSSLIPCWEDIIPRWSEMLTPLFIKGDEQS